MHGGDGGGGVGLRCCGNELAPAMVAASIRKGPWMAEEDAVLMDYVEKYGPRDWSSIRSKGLLPRTGKSCRLRYVNKLKPGLKTGCKLSAEEERVVIDLQARFGNKWARIATYLPGRTDNDVKNFWSTRQKRLAKLLQAPFPVISHRNQTKANGNSNYLPYSDPYVEVPDSMKMELMPNLDATPHLLEPAINARDLYFKSSSSPPQSPFNQSLLDLPLLSEGQYLITEFGEMSFPTQFGCAENSSTFFDFEFGGNGIKTEHLRTPESFFGDFPADVLDCLDQPPVV